MLKKCLLAAAVAALPMMGFAGNYPTQCPDASVVQNAAPNSTIDGVWKNWVGTDRSVDKDFPGFSLRWVVDYSDSYGVYPLPICFYGDGTTSSMLIPVDTDPATDIHIQSFTGSSWTGGPAQHNCDWAMDNNGAYYPVNDPSICSWQ